MLASKIGVPKLLDSYTSSMCADAWGRSSYARPLIEISSLHEVKFELSVAIPDLEGDNYTTATVTMDPELTLPRCSHCRTFGHESNACQH